MLLAILQVPDSAIARATHAVFQSSAYQPASVQQRVRSILGELLDRVLAWLGSVFGTLRHSSPAVWVVIALAALLFLAVATSVVLAWRQRRLDVARARQAERAALVRWDDPWSASQDLAARGDFTQAAHALYAALLESAARRQQVRLHPSKTVGDYARELRLRSSALVDRFRAFARVYEVVVYGLGQCDAARYQRLLELAGPVVQPNE